MTGDECGATQKYCFTIPLPPRTKKNSSQIVMAGKRRIIIPSQEYTAYEKDAAWFLPKPNNPIAHPVNIKAIYYMPTRRRVDLTNLNSALCDVLVKHRVIADDNSNIVASMDGSRVGYDKLRPRTEVEIEPQT